MRELNHCSAMMTAAECRAKADGLARAADQETHYSFVLELEGMATEWRRLAALADWQDTMEWALE